MAFDMLGVPIFGFVSLFIAFIFLSFLFKFFKGVSEWSHNNSLPITRVPSLLILKRVDVSTSVSHHHHHLEHDHHSSTTKTHKDYRVTFQEKETGKRHTFEIAEDLYDQLIEGRRFDTSRYALSPICVTIC